MMDTYGITINGKHTGRDYGLEWLAPYTIDSPKPKRNSIAIPGVDGVLDITAFLTGTDVKYDNRDIKFTLSGEGDYTKWDVSVERIKDDLHGQMCAIVPDTRPDFVYYGIVTVESEKDALEEGHQVTLSVDADPYKYERNSSLEPWVWDTFCFEGGIIRDYKDLEVNGTMMLMIPGRRKKVVPVFECSEKLTLEYGGVTYDLPAGKSKILDLQLGQGEHFLTFSGTGVVSVEYRGARL